MSEPPSHLPGERPGERPVEPQGEPQGESDDQAALSGLLDGELAPAHAAALRSRISTDPALRARWEALSLDHARWRAQAATAQAPMAMPRLPPPRSLPLAWLAALVVALAAGRLLPKVLPLDLLTALALHGILLAVALALVAIWVRRGAPLAA